MFRFLLPRKSREVLDLLEEYNKLANSLSAITAVNQTEDVAISLIRSGETVLDDMIVVLEQQLELSYTERVKVQDNIPNDIHIPCSASLGEFFYTNVDHCSRWWQRPNTLCTQTVDLIKTLQVRWRLYRAKGLSLKQTQKAVSTISADQTKFSTKKTPFWTPIDTLSLSVVDSTFVTAPNIAEQVNMYKATRSYFIRKLPTKQISDRLTNNMIYNKKYTFLL